MDHSGGRFAVRSLSIWHHPQMFACHAFAGSPVRAYARKQRITRIPKVGYAYTTEVL